MVARKEALRVTTSGVSGLAQRVLPFDASAAVAYAGIVDHRERGGTPMVGFDA